MRRFPHGDAGARRDLMDFAYGHAFTEDSPEAYERLILDALVGSAPLFFPTSARSRPRGGFLTRSSTFRTPGRPEPTRRARGPSSAHDMFGPRRPLPGGFRDFTLEE